MGLTCCQQAVDAHATLLREPQHHHHNASPHLRRARFARPETQDGYWDLGFMDSLDSRYVEQQAAAQAVHRMRRRQQDAQDGNRQSPLSSGPSSFA